MKRIVFVGVLFCLPLLAADFQCEAGKWGTGTGVTSGSFKGELSAVCTFSVASSGNLSRLAEALEKEIVEEVDEVHSGPTAATHEGMPAVYFDVTETEDAEGYKAAIRSDVLVATDGTDRLIEDTKSKSIAGEGQAKLLQKVDAFFRINRKQDATFSVLFSSGMQVKKPGIMPTAQFEKMVKSAAEKKLVELEADRIAFFQKNL